MRKIMYLLAVLGLVSLAACTEKDPAGGQNNGITNVNMPKSAEIGKSITVRAEGFDAAVAKLLFVDSANKETLIESPKFTSMGVSFVIPMSLQPGMHTLVAIQNDRYELGKIELKEPGLPISGLKCPEGAIAGQTLVIEGFGFPKGAQIVLANGSTEIKMDIKVVANGVEVQIPGDIATGDYKASLVSGKYSWTIVEKFTIFKVKTLKATSQKAVLINEGVELQAGWEVVKTGKEITSVIFSQKQTYPGNDVSEIKTTYSFEKNNKTYSFTPNTIDEANRPFTLTLADGKVISNTIERDNKTDEYKWSYTAEGYVEKLYKNTPDKPYITFFYKDGALVNYKGSQGASFDHTGAKVQANPCAPDVTKVLMFYDENFENFQSIATMLGWDGKGSISYPTIITAMDPLSGELVKYTATYTFDNDGYVSQISWGDAQQTVTLSFTYFE